MVSESTPTVSHGRTEPGRTFVCPFCGATFPSARRTCSRCSGTPVVPVDEAEVYETVHPMCGPDHHLSRPGHPTPSDDESGDDTSDGLRGWLSRLPTPGLSAWFAPVVERVTPGRRRT